MKKIIASFLVCSTLISIPINNVLAAEISYSNKNLNFIHENEIGNDFKYATPITLYSNTTGHIDKLPTDVDYYSLNIHEKREISIVLQAIDKDVVSNLRISVYDKNNNLIEESKVLYKYKYFDKQQMNIELDKGLYYIKIHSDKVPATVNRPYDMKILDMVELPVKTNDLDIIDIAPVKDIEVTEDEVHDYMSEQNSVLKQNGEWYKKWANYFKFDDSNINDPLLKFQYHIAQVNAPEAWLETIGEKEIIVAIIDQGIDTQNPELRDSSLKNINMQENGSYESVRMDHGTHTSGIVVGEMNNGVGISGIAPNVTLMPINAWDSTGKDRTEKSTADAIRYAVDNGARVISMSFSSNGFAPENNGDSKIVYDAIKYAYDNNVVLVASAGNVQWENPDYPALYDEVISVGGINGNDELWVYSNKGADIVAPGENVLSLGINGSYKPISGTSMAAPIVAGAAALILSKNPDLTNDEVRDILLNSADDLGDEKKFGHGRLNIGKAIKNTPESMNKVDKFSMLNDKWYKDAAIKMYENSIINYVQLNNLSQNADITTDEFLEIVCRYFNIPDVNEILKDISKIDMNFAISREKAFEIVYSSYKYLNGENDDALTFLKKNGIINGRSNNDYALKDNLKFTEAIQLLCNFNCK